MSLSGTGGFCASIFIVLLGFLPVAAQDKRSACPDIDASAAPAEQAVCWFQRDRSGSPDCISQDNETNSCIAQANAWCTDASFDDDAVTTTCLLTAVRAGLLTEAKEISAYLRSPSQTAADCTDALKRANLRILTNPKGAELIIDGQSYGYAPLEVRLLGNWWQSRIKARFASNSDITEVEVSPNELLGVFDKRECIFGDLVIRGPISSQTDFQLNQHPCSGTQCALESEDGKNDFWYWAGIVALAGAGIASGTTATFLFLDGKAEYEHLEEKCLGPAPRNTPGCYKGDIDISSIEDKYTAGRILAVSAGFLLTGATVLYIMKPDESEENESTDLSIGPTGISVTNHF